jgi:hypothetical protein
MVCDSKNHVAALFYKVTSVTSLMVTPVCLFGLGQAGPCGKQTIKLIALDDGSLRFYPLTTPPQTNLGIEGGFECPFTWLRD